MRHFLTFALAALLLPLAGAAQAQVNPALLLRTKLDCPAVAAVAHRCYEAMAEDMAKKIFGVGFSSLETKRGWITGVVRSGDRQAWVQFYPANRGPEVFWWSDRANLKISVNDLKLFEGNPYISREATWLNLDRLNTLRCEIETVPTRRDDLGNIVEYGRHTLVYMGNLNSAGTVKNSGKRHAETSSGDWTSVYTVPGLKYDADGFPQCLTKGLSAP